MLLVRSTGYGKERMGAGELPVEVIIVEPGVANNRRNEPVGCRVDRSQRASEWLGAMNRRDAAMPGRAEVRVRTSRQSKTDTSTVKHLHDGGA